MNFIRTSLSKGTLLLILFCCCKAGQAQDFTIPDTVCINTPVPITNNTVGASSYYWNFCVAGLNTVPTGTNIGNPGGMLSQPVFMDYTFYSGNYYGFLINHFPGKLVRLDFGNSLLNTPTATDFGNFGDIIPPGYGSEGIQIIQNEGKWYLIIVGGYTPSGSTPRILKVEFGADLLNPAPVATNWGNIGNMLQPLDLHIFRENNQLYGFTVNGENNTITRFSFTNSFDNTPTAVNLGGFGLLDYPTGIFSINDNGNWHVFVTNNGGPSRLVRFDFGNSLLNTPTAVNLGSVENSLGLRDLTIIKHCENITGFAVNGGSNHLIRIDFPTITSIPTYLSIGNIGSFNIPHSVSRIFRVNDDVYSFITNAGSNTITRIRFSGCTNSNPVSSTVQHPPSITYDLPGTYNINLTIDDGLATQGSLCKKVVVVPPLAHIPTKALSICQGDSVKIGGQLNMTGYTWNNGATTDSIIVKSGGTYWVESQRFQCTNRDSFTVTIRPVPLVNLGNDTSVCAPVTVVLDAGNTGSSFVWNNGTSQQTLIATTDGTYSVKVTGANGCIGRDTTDVVIFDKPTINITNDTLLCRNASVQLSVSGGATYDWGPTEGLSDPTIENPVASPPGPTMYYVNITDANTCKHLDSVFVDFRPDAVFAINGPVEICQEDSVRLSASGGNIYAWLPTTGISDPAIGNPMANPTSSTDYTVSITETLCNQSTILAVRVEVLPTPVVLASRSNDLDCSTDQSQLLAVGGSAYTWSPSATLDNPGISNPIARPVVTTEYIVKGTNGDGCAGYDTVSVKVEATGKGKYLLPNAFSPNSDGLNDCYGLKLWGGIIDLEFSLYNRWGEVVFFTKDPTKCWDGIFKGKKQDPGVFVYMVKAKTTCESYVFRKGTFVLVR